MLIPKGISRIYTELFFQHPTEAKKRSKEKQDPETYELFSLIQIEISDIVHGQAKTCTLKARLKLKILLQLICLYDTGRPFHVQQ